MILVFGFACAFLLSAISMPLILKVAHSRKLYDAIDDRKIHTGNIPRLGGLGIFLSFVATFALFTQVSGLGVSTGERFWTVILCMLAVHLIGLVDDFRNLRAVYKFLIEFAVAAVLVVSGFRFGAIVLPFGAGSLGLGAFSYPLTILWIIGVTNALNLIDGMDGLAGGIAALAAAVFGIFFVLTGNTGAALVCFILVGVVFGFLVFNLPPAKIFMGDSGALFLGFSLSILPLIGPASGRTEIGLVPTITVLLLLILDTLSAMIRRILIGVSVFTPDKSHLHHKLLDLGLGVKGALAVIMSAQSLLCLVALSGLVFARETSFFINISAWRGVVLLFVALGAARRRAFRQHAGGESEPQGKRVQPVTPKTQQPAIAGSFAGPAFETKRAPIE